MPRHLCSLYLKFYSLYLQVYAVLILEFYLVYK